MIALIYHTSFSEDSCKYDFVFDIVQFLVNFYSFIIMYYFYFSKLIINYIIKKCFNEFPRIYRIHLPISTYFIDFSVRNFKSLKNLIALKCKILITNEVYKYSPWHLAQCKIFPTISLYSHVVIHN